MHHAPCPARAPEAHDETMRNNQHSRTLGRSRKRTRRSGQQHVLALVVLMFIISVVLIQYMWHSIASEGGLEEDDTDTLREKWEEGLPLEHDASWQLEGQSETRSVMNASTAERQQPSIHAATIDTTVRYLSKLAELPPNQLWHMFGMEDANGGGYGEDPFSILDLETGNCPWSTDFTVEWLPPRPFNSESIAEKYRTNMRTLRAPGARPRRQMERYDAEKEVAIWYEHLSKAGGTTFCGLAKSNMMSWQVPRYHCMPGKGKLLDGR